MIIRFKLSRGDHKKSFEVEIMLKGRKYSDPALSLTLQPGKIDLKTENWGAERLRRKPEPVPSRLGTRSAAE